MDAENEWQEFLDTFGFLITALYDGRYDVIGHDKERNRVVVQAQSGVFAIEKLTEEET